MLHHPCAQALVQGLRQGPPDIEGVVRVAGRDMRSGIARRAATGTGTGTAQTGHCHPTTRRSTY
eukprot:11370743-Prorocentrum_lima.AAC.1